VTPPPLNVAALEVPHRFGQPEAQLALTDEVLSGLSGVDLALLPEAALTGYVSDDGDYDLRAFAEGLEGPTAARLAALARKHRLALAGPLIERAGTRCFNTTLVFDRKGRRLAHYRKRHPWMPERWASPGDLGTPLFEVAGVRLTVAVCFDVHFLEEDAARELGAADVLLFPSAWSEEGGDQRDARLPELARAFGVAVVNANWGKGAPFVEGQGASRIVDAEGRELARAASTGPVALTAAVSARAP
jgi:predicted amidohydrolase